MNPSLRVVAGIDGGGTHTRAALMDDDGRILGLGESGPSNIHAVPLAIVKKNIRLALQRARRAARLPAKTKCAAVFLGMAGVASERERRIIKKIAVELNLAPKNKIAVGHDIRIAHAGALGGRDGIVLIAGTGSACYGRRTDGQSARAGGFGPVLDDAGSGYDLARQAMIAIVRAEDGRAQKTALRKMLFSKLKLKTVRDLITRLHAQAMPRHEIAALAPFVIQTAERGDAPAQEIIARAASELALMAATVAIQLNFPRKVTLTITGGLAKEESLFKRELHRALRKRLPKCEIIEPLYAPVVGAGMLALQELNPRRMNERVPLFDT